MPHNQTAMIAAHKAGAKLATTSHTRAYVNDLARMLPVNEGDALLAGYYATLRRREAVRNPAIHH